MRAYFMISTFRYPGLQVHESVDIMLNIPPVYPFYCGGFPSADKTPSECSTSQTQRGENLRTSLCHVNIWIGIVFGPAPKVPPVAIVC